MNRLQKLAGIKEWKVNNLQHQISQLRDYNETEDFLSFKDYIIQFEHGWDGVNRYLVWKDMGENTGSDPNPEFESPFVDEVVKYLMSKHN